MRGAGGSPRHSTLVLKGGTDVQMSPPLDHSVAGLTTHSLYATVCFIFLESPNDFRASKVCAHNLPQNFEPKFRPK